jgi:rhamnulokinase
VARIAAVDLGASSGRVYVAEVTENQIFITERNRFANGAVERNGHFYWDFSNLMLGIAKGLTCADGEDPLDSIGVDSWAVDYGRLDADGKLLDDPFCYRDPRTASAVEWFEANGGLAALFDRTGVAHQPFNTLFQLRADEQLGLLTHVERLALIPDLVNYELTGLWATEFTNASTTQLLRVDGAWDLKLWSDIGVDPHRFGPLVQPGHVLGGLSPVTQRQLAMPKDVSVINVASHDTASAVLGVPATTPDFAYISCGTWSLVGMELDRPVLNNEAQKAGFSNERGAENTYRFLRNVMGLWVLQECLRTWALEGTTHDVATLVSQAREVPALERVIDINDASLLSPGDMPKRLVALCRQTGQSEPQTAAQFTRMIIDSLVVAYRDAIQRLETLTGRVIDEIHLVGGGVNNELLCQLTADACGRPVTAGPVEAAAIGNMLVQARALNIISGDRWAIRQYIREHFDLARYMPNASMTQKFKQF